jgi:hypothetical protein
LPNNSHFQPTNKCFFFSRLQTRVIKRKLLSAGTEKIPFHQLLCGLTFKL